MFPRSLVLWFYCRLCIADYFGDITRWSLPEPFFRWGSWGSERWSSVWSLHSWAWEQSWDSSPGLSDSSAFLFPLYLPWPQGALRDPHISVVSCMKLLDWNALVLLIPPGLSSWLPGRRFLPPPCSHIIAYVYCLKGKRFVVFTTRASAPRAEEPHILSIFCPHYWAYSSAYYCLSLNNKCLWKSA